MKKNVLIKGILLLIIIALALLTTVFTGCEPSSPWGTLMLIIAGPFSYYNYNVYLDCWDNQIGITSGGTFTVTGITPGTHTVYVDCSPNLHPHWGVGDVDIYDGQTSELIITPIQF
ncbi:hypothetical protein ES702_03962 [subsurface metagenome]